MNIPDQASESAARARHERDVRDGRYLSDRFQNWDTLPRITRRGFVEEAREELEAAAPFLMAQALREAAERVECEVDAESEAIPALQDWADEMEGK